MSGTVLGGESGRKRGGDGRFPGVAPPPIRVPRTFSPEPLEDEQPGLVLPTEFGLSPAWSKPIRVGFLISADTIALLTSFALAIGTYATFVVRQDPKVYLALLPLVAIFPLSYALSGLYPGFGVGPVETLRQLTVRTSFIFVVLAAGTFVLKLPPAYSRATFCIAWFSALFMVPMARFFTLRWLQTWDWAAAPALVLGPRSALSKLENQLAAIRLSGYRAALSFATDTEIMTGGKPMNPAATKVARHMKMLAESGIHVVVLVDDGSDHTSKWVAVVQEHFHHLILIRGHNPLPVEGVVTRDLGGVLGIEFQNQLLRSRNRILKRTMDLVITLTVGVIAAPLMGVAALAIKLISPGPVFFGQQREGRAGRFFTVWKLRTMHIDSQDRLETFLAENPAARVEWEGSFKLKKDPRILPCVGHLLRRLSIDELPQLWSVFKGEMSLVGPRPFPKYHLEKFEDEFLQLRRRVRPGLTGLWQVTCRSNGGLEFQEKYDTYYIRNWSVWMDLYVLAKTTIVVVAGKGAY